MTNKPTPDKPPPGWGPTHDLAFKKLLASPDHKTVAQGFIETFFGLRVAVGDIGIVNPYAIVANPNDTDPRRLIETFRDVTFTVPHEDLTVELQVRRLDRFEARTLYYTCNLFNSHFRENHPDPSDSDQAYDTLRPVHSVNVLKYRHFRCRHAVHTFDLTDTLWPTERLRLGWLKLGFVEMHKTKTQFKTETQRLWCDFLRSGQAPPGGPDYLAEAASMIEYMNLTREEKAVIDLAVKHEADRAAQVKWAKKHGEAIGEARGLALGEARGRAVGEARERRRLVETALDNGLSADEIVRRLGLPADEVTALAQQRHLGDRRRPAGAEA